jgi:hypothetical protein
MNAERRNPAMNAERRNPNSELRTEAASAATSAFDVQVSAFGVLIRRSP